MTAETRARIATAHEIAKWMHRNVERFLEPHTGEVDCTTMVEAWDVECADSEATLDEGHIAWEVAIDVKEAMKK
jgi:hypothetical protein